jgi:hypothetical protein
MPPVALKPSSIWRSAAPFLLVAALAIVGGGLLAAVLAHAPTRPVMWLVAYLVLVVGVVQLLLGAGQSWLAVAPPSGRLIGGECTLFNVGNALVMAGTLRGHPAWVSVGTLLFAGALGLFLRGVRHSRGGVWVQAYRALLWLVGASAVVGVLLATLRAYR